jgi:hypothetical protein
MTSCIISVRLSRWLDHHARGLGLTVCNALYFMKGSGIEHVDVPSAFLDLVMSKGYHPALGHALFADPAIQQEASTNCCDILAMH